MFMRYLAFLFLLFSIPVLNGQADFKEVFLTHKMQHFEDSDTGYVQLNYYDDNVSKFVFTKDSVIWTYNNLVTVFKVDMHIIQWKFRFFQSSHKVGDQVLRQLFYYLTDTNRITMAIEMPDKRKFLFWFYGN